MNVYSDILILDNSTKVYGVCPSTLSKIYITRTSKPNAKFYLNHHWGEGKAASGFGLDRIRTLVSMATDSSHRVIMGKTASSRFSQRFLIGSF